MKPPLILSEKKVGIRSFCFSHFLPDNISEISITKEVCSISERIQCKQEYGGVGSGGGICRHPQQEQYTKQHFFLIITIKAGKLAVKAKCAPAPGQSTRAFEDNMKTHRQPMGIGGDYSSSQLDACLHVCYNSQLFKPLRGQGKQRQRERAGVERLGTPASPSFPSLCHRNTIVYYSSRVKTVYLHCN